MTISSTNNGCWTFYWNEHDSYADKDDRGADFDVWRADTA